MQRRHRAFIAINLPQEIKRKLASYQERWAELPAKWTAIENLHITLEFLGDVDDQELADVCKIAGEVARQFEPFEIALTKIGYGPEKKIPPRYVWAVGEKSPQLSSLKRALNAALGEVVKLPADAKSFTPHVTLARIKEMEWRQIEPEERPEAQDMVNFQFEAVSVEIMESELKRGGPVYTVVDSHSLGENTL